MARRSAFGSEDESAEVDLSPMIDCIFILLIFFIVTTVFVEEQGIQVSKPEAAATSSPEESENLVLRITGEDRVLLDGEEIGVGDVTRHVRNRIGRGEDVPVMIRAHERSAHGTFVEVWDAAKRGGAEKLAFSTTQ